ncbi:hypothetical protein [Gluconobacter kanchanaburiensis]|uniref:Uncharacterized protein n=1 Tax=Gluconobacter kanchanaburiensis NBRC 103587 TaxID=1307948 RepID=A0A511B934_9PROT|nr:hypothetical protein [Gluconobacter kanchanaburiensis]MBF0862080.1 hypothetical protein [Gluconobacter kanchanaburiensis]GBR71155.1 hypothetical protein AA103587_2257 [Gluconobacter kanchanaburiensis NBRC 103587]GEK96824.1 hypothetical protein GKA01_20210 [Gluconobacter kanchanaburiensis NBRC 103587]
MACNRIDIFNALDIGPEELEGKVTDLMYQETENGTGSSEFFHRLLQARDTKARA